MRIANVNGRLTLLTDTAGVDVETASRGRFGAEPQAVFARWPEFRDWAAGASTAGGAPVADAGLGPPAPRPGPHLVTPDELADPDDLEIACRVGGEVVQQSRTSDMVFGVARLIAELSAILPLLPGDVIFTGTPAGIGATRKPPRFLQPGDVLESTIQGIGTLRNRCVAAS